ncbi:MAG: hypothetical protein D6712_20325 [Chloroflexi bacterium]|nr:MAG: hypothetical protein D6712_20325 [Chloroflexota bacterium]
MGTDIHPLAVTIARINYLLALSPHLRNTDNTGSTSLVNIPVYMGNALLLPLKNEAMQGLTVPVSDDDRDGMFFIPDESAQDAGLLTRMVQLTERIARSEKVDETRYQEAVRSEHSKSDIQASEATVRYWIDNLRLLKKLIDSDRNGIWAFILNNVARPLTFARRRFDFVVGNPPWLSYRFIKNKQYQAEVKMLYQYYGLIGEGEGKLVTQMDLSSLFYELVRDRYLCEGGKVAFVMPRSVITGAKQHRRFQRKGITRALDMRDVEPLFNVPTAVLIYEGDVDQDVLPLRRYSGQLPAHEMDLESAQPYLTDEPASLRFVEDGIRSPHYYNKVLNGATMYPRNLCFVVPEDNPSSPAVKTDPAFDKVAKTPYKGVFLRGIVEDAFYYATLLSKHLVPFGYERLHAVALPFLYEDGEWREMGDDDFLYRYPQSGEWFRQAAQHWEKYSKDGETKSFAERLNFHNTMVNQNPQHRYKVIQNTSGTNISAAVIDLQALNLIVHGRQARAFVVDCTTFYYDAASADEAHYLCAILNTDSVNQAIKPYQPQGSMGPRHIQRTPFEACGIPPFDPNNDDHRALANLSREAHEVVALLKSSGQLTGSSAGMRNKARNATKELLEKMDVIVKRIVEM